MDRSAHATVLLLDPDRERAAEYADRLDGYEARTADDVESALDALDGDVDVVLLDGDFVAGAGPELIGRIRSRRPDCQIGLLSGATDGLTVLGLDVDEHVPRPVTRDELRRTVARLVDRGAVTAAVEQYLSLAARRRRVESRRDPDELSDDDRYRELRGETAARRRQIDTLLAQAAEADAADSEVSDADALGEGDGTPLYRSRAGEFYALWLVAALTYGVGDVVSTLYATVAVPGLIEANPVVGGLLGDFGVSGFLLLKLLVFLVLISVSVHGARSREPFSYYWPPVAAAGLGLALTGWNLRLIVGG
ncbi:HalX domain-containing protein [Halorubrum trueperi]|uniref:HalX domain-containing protein n=1 Tax=Halorubrum trueperi TaxID=2004704 RepID=A0ABD5UEF9_9EURY